jgi:hypothetical protein
MRLKTILKKTTTKNKTTTKQPPPPPKKKIPTDYQIKSSRISWVGGWVKSNEALNLLQLGKAYNGRMNTQTKAMITKRETIPFDRYDVTDSPQRM